MVNGAGIPVIARGTRAGIEMDALTEQRKINCAGIAVIAALGISSKGIH